MYSVQYLHSKIVTPLYPFKIDMRSRICVRKTIKRYMYLPMIFIYYDVKRCYNALVVTVHYTIMRVYTINSISI